METVKCLNEHQSGRSGASQKPRVEAGKMEYIWLNVITRSSIARLQQVKAAFQPTSGDNVLLFKEPI